MAAEPGPGEAARGTELRLAGPPGPRRLEWPPGTDWRAPTGGGLLPAFVRLREATDEEILAFARARGVLGGRERAITGPLGSASPLGPADRFWEQPASRRSGSGRPEPTPASGPYWEPLAAWRHLAGRFRALLSLAHDLRAGDPGALGDWTEAAVEPLRATPDGLEEALAGPDRDEFGVYRSMHRLGASTPEARPALIASQDEDLRRALDRLVDAAGLRPALLAGAPGNPRLGLVVADPARVRGQVADAPPRHGLFPGLVGELVEAAASPRGLFRCSRCGTAAPATGERQPRGDRQRFCTEACRRDAKREANRESERRRYAKLKAEGLRGRSASTIGGREAPGGTDGDV